MQRDRGQPSKGFYLHKTNELIEVRAWQRTFDGAYGRAALSNLGYAAVFALGVSCDFNIVTIFRYSFIILRLFDKKFYRSSFPLLGRRCSLIPITVGLLYALLSAFLFAISFVRSRHAKHTLADDFKSRKSCSDGTQSLSPEAATEKEQPLVTRGLEGKPSIGSPFHTSGHIVFAIVGVVAAVELGLLVLVLQL